MALPASKRILLNSNVRPLMPWDMKSDASIRDLPVADQLFAFADAYLKASLSLCERAAANSDQNNWPNGAVILMLAAHSVELFLKGAILRRSPDAKVWDRGHNITGLVADFERLFPGPAFSWDVPFRESVLDSLSPEQLQLLRSGSAPPSILFRYPVSKQGASWLSLLAFEPHSFLRTLAELQADYRRIREAVA